MSSNIATRLHRGVNMVIISECQDIFSSKIFYKCPEGTDGVATHEIRKRGKMKPVYKIEVHEERNEGQRSGCAAKSCRSILRPLSRVFLPFGFPDSVSRDYLSFQLWDTLQNFMYSLSGSIATEAVLKAYGVGNENASTLAATITMLIQKLSGRIGTIFFVWISGTSLDHNSKKWKLVADVLGNAVIAVDLITPLFPSSARIYLFCVSSFIKSVVGVALSSTKNIISLNMARVSNTADVTAKERSQENAVTLLALILTVITLPYITGNTLVVWSIFGICASIHIFSNYRGLRSLRFQSINTTRLLISLKQYLKTGNVPTVEEANVMESLVVGFGITDYELCKFHVSLGVSIRRAVTAADDVVESGSGNYLNTELRFLILPTRERRRINVVLHQDITSLEMIEAYSRAILTAYYYTNNENSRLDAMDRSISRHWENFCHCLQSAGFNTDQAVLKSFAWRATWETSIPT